MGGGTAYRLCIYDMADRVVGQLHVDRAGQVCGPKNKACWKAVESRGYAYRDGTLSADGVKRLRVVAGSIDEGRIRLKAANVARNPPALPTGITTALEGNDRATVQLVTSDAGCVSVTLDRVKEAEGSIFRATGP